MIEYINWATKLYPKNCSTHSHHDDWFWEELQIKSGPKFKDCCWSHIPKVWTEDVVVMVASMRDVDPNVEFIQIKEKFFELVVYFKSDKKDEINKIIDECKRSLMDKGVHPK